MLHIGMTGTREKLTLEQFSWLDSMIQECDVLHHGACINADEEAHDAAFDYYKGIVIHPPTNERLMMPRWKFEQATEIRPAKPYNARNLDIVRESDRLIALPNGPYRQGSGTWNTIGFAEGMFKRVTICYPDGTIEDRVPRVAY
jgi:hypothetical protein